MVKRPSLQVAKIEDYFVNFAFGSGRNTALSKSWSAESTRSLTPASTKADHCFQKRVGTCL